tara:strand:+ start:84 stop:305 length:222 start_codon:yes stop_codon:yes gene_type:complete
MNKMYNLGESVVHRNSKKMGKVVDAADTVENGITITEAVKVQFEDGSTEWHSTSAVSKMLYEVEPDSGTFLGD